MKDGKCLSAAVVSGPSAWRVTLCFGGQHVAAESVSVEAKPSSLCKDGAL